MMIALQKNLCSAFPLSPRGRGREAMTYDRELLASRRLPRQWRDRKSFGRTGEGQLASSVRRPPHPARLAEGEPSCWRRVFDTMARRGTFSPRGEGTLRLAPEHP